MGAKNERWIVGKLQTVRGVDQDGNNAAGRFANRFSDSRNLDMISARGGLEQLVSNVGSDQLGACWSSWAKMIMILRNDATPEIQLIPGGLSSAFCSV